MYRGGEIRHVRIHHPVSWSCTCGLHVTGLHPSGTNGGSMFNLKEPGVKFRQLEHMLSLYFTKKGKNIHTVKEIQRWRCDPSLSRLCNIQVRWFWVSNKPMLLRSMLCFLCFNIRRPNNKNQTARSQRREKAHPRLQGYKDKFMERLQQRFIG